MAARAIYKARLCLDSVEVPIKFYAAVEDRSVRFRLLHEADKQPVSQQLLDKTTQRPVERDAVRKAYQTEDGRLVRLQPDELLSLEPAASRAVEVTRFVEPSLIDESFYDRPYYLGPDGDEQAYFSLCAALSQRGVEGIAHWVMRKRAYVGALREQDGYLVLMTLRHAEEVVDIASFRSSETKEISKAELQLARQLVDTLKGPFEPELFQDDYRARIEGLIDIKVSGKVISLPKPKKKAAPSDLADVLRSSLRSAKKKSA